MASQLREDKLFARSVTLKLRYSDFKTVTRCHTLRTATADDGVIFHVASALLRKLFTSCSGVRLIGISLSSLGRHRFQQVDLFDSISLEQRGRLLQSIDHIRGKYGFHSILRAGSFHKG